MPITNNLVSDDEKKALYYELLRLGISNESSFDYRDYRDYKKFKNVYFPGRGDRTVKNIGKTMPAFMNLDGVPTSINFRELDKGYISLNPAQYLATEDVQRYKDALTAIKAESVDMKSQTSRSTRTIVDPVQKKLIKCYDVSYLGFYISDEFNSLSEYIEFLKTLQPVYTANPAIINLIVRTHSLDNYQPPVVPQSSSSSADSSEIDDSSNSTDSSSSADSDNSSSSSISSSSSADSSSSSSSAPVSTGGAPAKVAINLPATKTDANGNTVKLNIVSRVAALKAQTNTALCPYPGVFGKLLKDSDNSANLNYSDVCKFMSATITYYQAAAILHYDYGKYMIRQAAASKYASDAATLNKIMKELDAIDNSAVYNNFDLYESVQSSFLNSVNLNEDTDVNTQIDYVTALSDYELNDFDESLDHDDLINFDEAVSIDDYQKINNYSSINKQYDIYVASVIRDTYAAVKKGDPVEAAFRISKSSAVGDSKIKYREPRRDANGEIIKAADTNAYLDKDLIQRNEDGEIIDIKTAENIINKPEEDSSSSSKEEIAESLLSMNDSNLLAKTVNEINNETDLANFLFYVLSYSKDAFSEVKEVAQDASLDLRDKKEKIKKIVLNLREKDDSSADNKEKNEQLNHKMVRESLNRIDLKTDCEYDLRNLFDSLQCTNEQLEEIINLLKHKCSAERIYKLMMKQCGQPEPQKSRYKLVQKRPVKNFDGEKCMCSWYKDLQKDVYLIIIGDPSIYKPESCDYDFVSKDYREALEWFYELPNYDDMVNQLADEISDNLF